MAENDAITVELKGNKENIKDIKEYMKGQDERNRQTNEHMVRCEMLHANAAEAIKRNYKAIIDGHDDLESVRKELKKDIDKVDRKKQPPIGKYVAIAVAFLSVLIVIMKYVGSG